MQLLDELSSEAHRAIVECLRIAYRRGRAIREERERQQKAKSAEMLGSDAADLAGNSGGTNISGKEVYPMQNNSITSRELVQVRRGDERVEGNITTPRLQQPTICEGAV